MAKNLLEWLPTANIKLNDNLSIVKAQRSWVINTDKAVKAGTVLIEYSVDSVLSLDTSDFVDIKFTDAQNALIEAELTPYSTQTLLLLYEYLKPECAITFGDEKPQVKKKKKKKNQRAKATVSGPVKGKQSQWAPLLEHIVALDNLHTPASWTGENRDILKGTSLEKRMEAAEKQLREEYETIFVPFLKDTSIQCPEDKLSFELFKKLRSFAMAHSWADEAAEIYILPLSDCLTFSIHNAKTNIEMKYLEKSIQLVATRKINVGEKLCSSAGEIGTAECLWKFGFIDHLPTKKTPKGSKFDSIEIDAEYIFELYKQFSSDEDVPDERVFFMDALDLIDSFVVERGHSIPNELLLVVKILFMTDEEFEIYKQEMKSYGFAISDDDDDDDDNDDDDGDNQDSFDLPFETVESDDDEPLPAVPEAAVTGIKPDSKSSNNNKSSNKQLAESKSEKAEPEDNENVAEDEDEELEDLDDVGEETLPAIVNELKVYQFLLRLFTEAHEKSKPTGTPAINWEKPGIIRKPALAAEYLRHIEHEISGQYVGICQEQIKKVESEEQEKVDSPAPEPSKKRKLSDAKSPPTKKAKK